MRGLLFPLVLLSVLNLTAAQLPVSFLCSTVRCLPGNVCRVIQQCPTCPPRPVCVPCVPRGVDAVCNRNRYLNTLLTGNPLIPSSISARVCNPFQPRSCPFDSVCVAEGTGLGNCCYNRAPPGIPSVNRDPVCIVNRCGPSCPFGQRCELVTICPFVPPCFQEYQCRSIFIPFGLTSSSGNDS
nr:latent-transforming growth factor beta-binding protein 4 [Biomphalaria glabrata]